MLPPRPGGTSGPPGAAPVGLGGPFGPDRSPHTGRPARSAPRGGRPAPRALAAAVCLVLGVGLLGGSVAGALLADGPAERAAAAGAFEHARGLWHNAPVDALFPPTLKGEGAGPGGADRRWTRVAVAPDDDCAHAFDPLLAKALSPAGCSRLLRATYTDETTTGVTTVGLLFTRGDKDAMHSLRERFTTENLGERTDLMPRPYAARGTVAAGFGDPQRASWTVQVMDDMPVVLYAVTGFADGRAVSEPQPAAEAVKKGQTTAPAQAGLGHDARGIADRVRRSLREAAAEGRAEAAR